MKIVHVSDAFAPVMGGIETQVSRLASEQVQAGHQVTVLTTTMRDPARGVSCGLEGAEPRGLSADPVGDPAKPHFQVLRSEWPNPLRLPVDPRGAQRFLDYLKSDHPDVVHAHLGELTPVTTAVLLGLKSAGIPTVVSVHSVWSKFPTIPAYVGLGRLAGLSDAPFMWLCNSELTASRVRQVVNPSLVEVHNNTVDPKGWLKPVEPHAGLRVVTATRFAPRKRVPQTLRILRQVGNRLRLNVAAGEGGRPADHPVLTAVLAGEGPGLPRARRFLSRNDMDGWVETPGRLSREELIALYSRSDIYLAPSVKDAFSISGLEARAAGLAILTRAQSGFGAAVLDGVEGRGVHTDRQLADVLVEWARNPSAVEDFKDHNRRVPMPYTWELALPKFEGAYRAAALLVGTGGA